MKSPLLAAAAAGLLGLGGCSSLGIDRLMGRSPAADPALSVGVGAGIMGAATPTGAEAYLLAAAESDLFEITSSQLALQRTQNPEVRAFANQLIDHHTATTNAALAAARKGGVMPPPAVLNPRGQALIAQLSSQTGFAFDRLYVQQQIPAHEEALALHAAYARGGDNGALRGSAAAAVPFVSRHLQQARTLETGLGAL